MGIGHWVRVAFLLVLLGILTWYGKHYEPKRNPVRNHGLLGWALPGITGISLLVVLPDDGNDTNLVRTGHRIWLWPPLLPQRLEREQYALFRGPTLTVVASGLELVSLQDLANMVDSGGKIHLVGWQRFAINQLEEKFPHLSWQVTEPGSGGLWWEDPLAGEDARLRLRICPAKRMCGSGEILAAGYRVGVTWGGHAPPTDTMSLWVDMDKMRGLDNPLVGAVLGYGEYFSDADSTRIALKGPHSGAVFVEDELRQRLLVRKLTLK